MNTNPLCLIPLFPLVRDQRTIADHPRTWIDERCGEKRKCQASGESLGSVMDEWVITYTFQDDQDASDARRAINDPIQTASQLVIMQ